MHKLYYGIGACSFVPHAALEAIRRARFAPATGADGTAVAGSGTIRVRFELPGSRR